MTFDISQLDEDLRRWIPVGLSDMQIQIRRLGPVEQERFRQSMVRAGVMKKNAAAGVEMVSGKDAEFCRGLAETYVTGWKNLSIGEVQNPPFDAQKMGDILSKSTSALKALTEALGEEQDFFSGNGSGSTD